MAVMAKHTDNPWPTPWLKGHGTDCPACQGEGSRKGTRCGKCKGLGIVSKTPSQIVAETVAENERHRSHP